MIISVLFVNFRAKSLKSKAQTQFTSQTSATRYICSVRGPIFRSEVRIFLMRSVSSIFGTVRFSGFGYFWSKTWSKSFGFLNQGQVHFWQKMLILNQIELNRLELIDQVQSLFCNIFYFQPNYLPRGLFFSFRMWIFNFQKFESDTKWAVHKGESA